MDVIDPLRNNDVNTSVFIETLGKILELGKKKKSACLTKMAEAGILEKLREFFRKLNATKNPFVFNDFDFVIGTVMQTCSFVVQSCRGVASREDFHTLMNEMKQSIKTAVSIKKVNRSVLFSLDELETAFQELAIKKKPAKQQAKPAVVKLSEFRKIELLPTNVEVNQSTLSVVKPVTVKGAYDSVESYLDNQFRLLREDYVDVIRTGVKLFRDTLANTTMRSSHQRYESIRVYSAVHFEKSKFSELGNIAYTVNFDPLEKITMNFETTKYFMHGSLLLFSRNDFQTFFCASILHRDVDVLNSGKLYVTVEQNGDFKEDFLFQSDYTMIEADAFWEPYSLVLRVLQNFSVESFPMCKYIVDTSSQVDTPRYLHSFRDWDVFGHSTLPLDFDSWPSGHEIGLDEHQYNALKTALTKQFCVIQGPPGTGKTFLGLKIVEILLTNMDAHELYIRNPILIVCFTNHALDQFLEGILEFNTRIIRVGGQSRSEKLSKYNFKERKALRKNPKPALKKERMDDSMRRAFEADRKLRQAIGRGRRECATLLARIDQLNENLEILDKPRGILSFDCLAEVIDKKSKEVLNSDHAMIWWLLDEKEDNFAADHEANNLACLDELKYDIVIDENTLKKEIYGELFQVEEETESDDEDKWQKEETMKYGVSLNGLGAVCLHYRKELNTIKDESSIEYTWAKNHLIDLVHRYFILKENLDKTLVDQTLYEKICKTDLTSLPLDHRWNTYFYWIEAKKKAIKAKIKVLKDEYRAGLRDVEKLQQEEDASILSSACVIGMTTTSGARCHKVMEILKPSIVIVEEAAEVLEAHIVASLNVHTEHVILIGDHKQLKPSTATNELSKNYNLDCSLFERMINNGMHCPVLQVQHRMRPEISSLITPAIYKNLENHVSVEMFESIKGVLKNVFFVDHTSPDNNVENSTSFINTHEAGFVVELCTYLLDQGYDPESITILTAYAAQMMLIKRIKTAKISKVRVHVVDEYQGEENDIIILSLVRSNPQGNIGFLRTENRVCVALSRAKKGFYLIGNMAALAGSSSLWSNIREKLIQNEGIGSTLTLRCEKHGTRTEVATAEDFSAVRGGGCKLKCGDILPCSHVCAQSCHIADPDHEEEFACRLLSLRPFDCGHILELPCSQKSYVCKEKVEFKSSTCKHTLTRECFNLDTSMIKCENMCRKKLRCGHECPRVCHPDDPNHENYMCQQVCGRKTKNCSENHTCSKICSEPCGNCMEPRRFSLPCGHTPLLPCSTDPAKAWCSEVCGKICDTCRKPCQKLCWEDCKPCSTRVQKRVDSCDHFIEVSCSVNATPELCDAVRIVAREATCGHDLVYGVPCGVSQNPDFDTSKYLANCEELCRVTLGCGHKCTGTCGECVQGRLHVGCKKKCDLTLPCGHECAYACGDVCPPCWNYSFIGCKHTKETRKCGALYASCTKRCESKCKHQACTKTCGELCNREPCYKPCEQKVPGCNHPCIGFCGEPCICRWCDGKGELPDSGRFVMLEDCGCILESHALEEYLHMNERYIYMYVCPQCEKPIVSTQRFMNRIKNKYKDIIAVNRRVHGLDQQLTNMRSQVIDSLKEFFHFIDDGLPGIMHIKVYFSRTLSDKHSVMNKQDLASMKYFLELFNTISRRLQCASGEILDLVEFEKGAELVSQVVDRVQIKSLLKNRLAMNSLRMELIRMHRILDFCVLLHGTSSKRFKKCARLSEIRDEIRRTIYAPTLFGVSKDRSLDAQFDEFLSLQPSTSKNFSFLDEKYMDMRYQDFLDGSMTVHNWVACAKNKHLYPEVYEDCPCPKC